MIREPDILLPDPGDADNAALRRTVEHLLDLAESVVTEMRKWAADPDTIGAPMVKALELVLLDLHDRYEDVREEYERRFSDILDENLARFPAVPRGGWDQGRISTHLAPSRNLPFRQRVLPQAH